VTSHPRGTFYGVGIGPGDPELLTLKAVRVLRSVDWLFVPASAIGGESYARRILTPLELPAERFRQVPINMSRDRTVANDDYRQAAEQIVAELEAGRSVAWLTKGDPLFYSTFVYVLDAVQALRPDVTPQIVPGVTSIHASAAAAGFPLTRLSDPLAVVPAAYGVEHLPQLLAEFATVALLKVNTSFDSLLDVLASSGQACDTLYVEHAGAPEQRIVRDLASLRGPKLPYFSLVLLRRRPEATR